MTDPIVLLQILWTGAVTASSYVLLTVAFSLTQKVTGLWNFAQAGTMGIAFYAMFFVLNDLGLPLFAALPFGAACAAAAGIAIEAWGLDVLRARHSGNLTYFIFTLILAELVIYILTLLFGTEPQTLFATILSPVHIVGGIAISDWDLRAVGVTAAALVALQLFLRFGKEGQFLIAVADNAKLAELYGISARRAYCVTAAIAGILITLAMYLAGARSGITPNSAMELILTAVIGTLLGGMGRVFMGGLASLVLALIQSYSVLVIGSRWQNLLIYGFLFVAIVVFPHGIHLPHRRPRAPAPATPVQAATQEG
jgi:branched-subunit amino acid ABC-type transport system permease component